MKGIQKRLGSLLMAAVMLLSLAVTPAMAAVQPRSTAIVKTSHGAKPSPATWCSIRTIPTSVLSAAQTRTAIC